MIFCDAHWQALKQAIVDKGMWPLVGRDGKSAIEALIDDPNGDMVNFDPLLRTSLMIYERAVEIGGLYLFTKDAQGKDYCPLCELNTWEFERPPKSAHATLAASWIDGCTTHVQNQCRRLGRIPKLS